MDERVISEVMGRANAVIAQLSLPETKKALEAATGLGEIKLSYTEAMSVASQLEAMATDAVEAATPISLGVSCGNGADSLKELSAAVSELAVAVGGVIQSEADYVRHLVESMVNADRQVAGDIAS